MEISKFGINQVQLNSARVKNSPKINCSDCDSVSFSGTDEKGIPYRLACKTQDDFHVTSLQIYIRDYLKLKNQGLTEDEIISSFVSGRELTEKERDEMRVFISKVKGYIDKHDANFKKVIPLLVPKTYYRGVFGGKDNYAIQVLSSAKVGDIVQPDLGYSFLTANKSYAKDYTSSCEGIKDPENSLMMIIKAPIGTPISRDFAFDRSIINSNVVLARGANFEVLDKKVKDGTTYITLKYLNCATDRGE